MKTKFLKLIEANRIVLLAIVLLIIVILLFLIGMKPVTLAEQILINNGGVESLITLDSSSLSKMAISLEAYNIRLEEDGGEVFFYDEIHSLTSIYVAETGMYKTEDNYGEVYYFRGAVDNNWVYFGGFYWRIINIDQEGNIKMIYSGKEEPTVDESVIMTGDSTSMEIPGESTHYTIFNNYTVDNGITAAIGYVYEEGYLHGNESDSVIKEVLEEWYETYLEVDYQSYLTYDYYCVDRSTITYVNNSLSEFIETELIIFNAVDRLEYGESTLKCSDYAYYDEINLYVGLISVDEVIFAGAGNACSFTNEDYYLYTNQDYWTISPHAMSVNGARIYSVSSKGYVYSVDITSTIAVRPVVTLSSDNLYISGSGVYNDPYTVE